MTSKKRNKAVARVLLWISAVASIGAIALVSATVRTEYVDVNSGRFMSQYSVLSMVLSTHYSDSEFYYILKTRPELATEPHWQIASRRYQFQRASGSFRGGRVTAFFDNIVTMINTCRLSSSDVDVVLRIAIRVASAKETGLVGEVTFANDKVEIHDGDGTVQWTGKCGGRD